MKKMICLFTILCQMSLISLYAADQAGDSAQSKIKTAEAQASEATIVNQEQPAQVKKMEPSVQAKSAEQQPVQAKMVLREKISDQNPLRKIARGTVNVTLGWTEIPRQMIKVNKDSGDIAGVFWGPLKGFAFFLGRTAVGVYEVTTFLLPPYKPVVNPEFILSDDNATDDE
ncbi:MAG: exosortase system-associated protein, TIGR04073 family [Candidatus Omnitrophota bacterium]|jgi:putative exosortase-associated protein (TIGR04073 family)